MKIKCIYVDIHCQEFYTFEFLVYFSRFYKMDIPEDTGEIVCTTKNNSFVIHRNPKTQDFYDTHYATISKMSRVLEFLEYHDETIEEFVKAVNNNGFCLFGYLVGHGKYPNAELIDLLRMYFVKLVRYDDDDEEEICIENIDLDNRKFQKFLSYNDSNGTCYFTIPNYEIVFFDKIPNKEVVDWVIFQCGGKSIDFSYYKDDRKILSKFIAAILVKKGFMIERYLNFANIQSTIGSLIIDSEIPFCNIDKTFPFISPNWEIYYSDSKFRQGQHYNNLLFMRPEIWRKIQQWYIPSGYTKYLNINNALHTAGVFSLQNISKIDYENVPWLDISGGDIVKYATPEQIVNFTEKNIKLADMRIRHLLDLKDYPNLQSKFSLYDEIIPLLQNKEFLTLLKTCKNNPDALAVVNSINNPEFNDYRIQLMDYVKLEMEHICKHDRFYVTTGNSEDRQKEFSDIFSKMFQ